MLRIDFMNPDGFDDCRNCKTLEEIQEIIDEEKLIAVDVFKLQHVIETDLDRELFTFAPLPDFLRKEFERGGQTEEIEDCDRGAKLI